MTKAKPKARGKGEGTVYQRQSDGRWVGAVTLPGGVRKYVYGKTQAEAIRKRDALRASVAVGVLPSSATVGEWCDYWIDTIAPANHKATTLDRHRGYIETWIKPTIGNVRLQELQPDHVRMMMRKMGAAKSERTGKPLAPGTIAKARTVLQAALSQAVNDGRVLRNAATFTDPPRPREPKLRRLSTAEARKVIDACTDTRNRARLAVALMAGLRQGEALALRWENVTLTVDGGALDIKQAATRVRNQGMVQDVPKTLRSVRLVPLSPAAASMLLAWRERSGGVGYVFPGVRGPEVIEDGRRDYEVWKQALIAAKVPHVRLHDARGTAESHMASQVPSWVAAEIMGHSDDTARRVYIRGSQEQRELAAGATDIIGTKEEA